jgi:MFS family permease
MSGEVAGELVRLRSARGRAVLAAMALGSGMAFLDGTVVNVALPVIGQEFDAPLAALQWTVNAYTLTLAALIMLGGAERWWLAHGMIEDAFGSILAN